MLQAQFFKLVFDEEGNESGWQLIEQLEMPSEVEAMQHLNELAANYPDSFAVEVLTSIGARRIGRVR